RACVCVLFAILQVAIPAAFDAACVSSLASPLTAHSVHPSLSLRSRSFHSLTGGVHESFPGHLTAGGPGGPPGQSEPFPGLLHSGPSRTCHASDLATPVFCLVCSVYDSMH